jgi:hypothetical protein
VVGLLESGFDLVKELHPCIGGAGSIRRRRVCVTLTSHRAGDAPLDVAPVDTGPATSTGDGCVTCPKETVRLGWRPSR